MKPLLVDLNVLLDVILERQPGVEAATRLWAMIERGAGRALIPAHGVTTVFYLLAKARGARFARDGIERLLTVFGVAGIDALVLRRALTFGWPDFEDAVCAAAAEAAGCHAIVTRDPSGYRNAGLPVIDPAAAISWMIVNADNDR